MNNANQILELSYQNNTLNIPIQKGVHLVPVKRICELIDADFQKQDSWLKNHPMFSQLYTLGYTVGADNKQRKMNCLSLFDCCLWLASIQNNNRREGSYQKQMALLTWLREQFLTLHKSIEIYKAENDYELELQQKKEQLEQEILEASSKTKELKKELSKIDKTIEDIRFNRFTGQTALPFDEDEE